MFLIDESEELARTSNITAFADIDESHIAGHVKQVETREPHGLRTCYRQARRLAYGQRHITANKLIGGTTAATHDIHQSLVYELAYLRRHRLCRLIVKTKRVRQSGIRIAGYIIRCALSQFLEEGFHLAGTKRAVQAYREDGICGNAGQEGIECLSAERASGKVTDCNTEHNGQIHTALAHHRRGSIDGTLGVQRIKDGLNKQSIHPTLNESIHLFHISIKQLTIRQIATGGITDVRRHRARFVCRTDTTGHKARLVICRELIGSLTRQLGTSQSYLTGFRSQTVVSLTDALRTESVSLNNVSTGTQVTAMNIEDDVWTRQVEHVVIALHLSTEHVEAAAEVFLRQVVRLNHRTHSAVKHQNALLDDILNLHHYTLIIIH